MPQGSDPLDPTYYAVVAPVRIWRQSFSTHTVRDENVVSNFSVGKDYAQAIVEVLSRSPSTLEVPVGSSGQKGVCSFGVEKNWSTYSHLISISAPKLYGAR